MEYKNTSECRYVANLPFVPNGYGIKPLIINLFIVRTALRERTLSPEIVVLRVIVFARKSSSRFLSYKDSDICIGMLTATMLSLSRYIYDGPGVTKLNRKGSDLCPVKNSAPFPFLSEPG